MDSGEQSGRGMDQNQLIVSPAYHPPEHVVPVVYGSELVYSYVYLQHQQEQHHVPVSTGWYPSYYPAFFPNATVQGTPANATMQGIPVNAYVQRTPANAGVQSIPANAYVQGTPANAYVPGTPANAYVPGTPANAYVPNAANTSVQSIPTNAYVQSAPANAYVQSSPANASVQSIPANAYVQGTPANATMQRAQANAYVPIAANTSVQSIPTNASMQSAPANAYVQSTPANACVQRIPVHATVQRIPANAYVQSIPANAYVQRTPAHATVQRIPAHATVQRTPAHATVQRIPAHATVQRTPENANVQVIAENFNVQCYILPNSQPPQNLERHMESLSLELDEARERICHLELSLNARRLEGINPNVGEQPRPWAASSSQSHLRRVEAPTLWDTEMSEIIVSLEWTNHQMLERICRLETDVSRLRGRINELESVRNQLQHEIDSLLSENVQLRELKLNRDQLQHETDRLRSENVQLRELELAVDQRQHETDGVPCGNVQLRDEIDASMSEILPRQDSDSKFGMGPVYSSREDTLTHGMEPSLTARSTRDSRGESHVAIDAPSSVSSSRRAEYDPSRTENLSFKEEDLNEGNQVQTTGHSATALEQERHSCENASEPEQRESIHDDPASKMVLDQVPAGESMTNDDYSQANDDQLLSNSATSCPISNTEGDGDKTVDSLSCQPDRDSHSCESSSEPVQNQPIIVRVEEHSGQGSSDPAESEQDNQQQGNRIPAGDPLTTNDYPQANNEQLPVEGDGDRPVDGITADDSWSIMEELGHVRGKR